MVTKAKKAVQETVVASPVVPSDAVVPRTLSVEFIGDTPQFTFKGDWGVRNILTFKRLLSREFKLYRRTVLRNAITNKEKIV